MNAADANAKRLAEDAVLLLKSKRYASAAALAALAIEEAGKSSILRELALARDERERQECWRDYRTHAKKNVAWLLPQLVAAGARRLDDFRPLYDQQSDHPHLLDQVKQISFYTDCLGQAHWSAPAEVIDVGLAKSLVGIANVLGTRTYRTSAAEVELWIKHLGPVWKTTNSLMRGALNAWHEEMVQRGLEPDDGLPDFISQSRNTDGP